MDMHVDSGTTNFLIVRRRIGADFQMYYINESLSISTMKETG